jgi:hypothetical protein
MEDRFDNVSPEELDELRTQNEDLELRRYNAEVNVFRADVALRLQQLALDTGSCWAHYKIYGQGGPFVGSEFDIFLLREFYMVGKFVVPSIRLFKVERFNQQGGTENIVTDVIVDRDGDAIASFGSKYHEGPKEADPEIEEEAGNDTAIEEIAIKPSGLVVVPSVVEGKLTFDGDPGQSPTVGQITGSVNRNGVHEAQKITPFGDWTNLPDKWHALGKASTIFGEIKGLDPDNLWLAGSS